MKKLALHWRLALAGEFSYLFGLAINQVVLVTNGTRKMPEVNLDGTFDVTPHLAIFADRAFFNSSTYLFRRTYSIGDGFIFVGLILITLSLALIAVAIKRRYCRPIALSGGHRDHLRHHVTHGD